MENQDRMQQDIEQRKKDLKDKFDNFYTVERFADFYNGDIYNFYWEVFKEAAAIGDYYRINTQHAWDQGAFDLEVQAFIIKKKKQYENNAEALLDFEMMEIYCKLDPRQPEEVKKLIEQYVEKLSPVEENSQVNYLKLSERRKMLEELLAFASANYKEDVSLKTKISAVIETLIQAEKSSFKKNFLKNYAHGSISECCRKITFQGKKMTSRQQKAREKDIKRLQVQIEEIMKDDKKDVKQCLEEVKKAIADMAQEMDKKKSIFSVGRKNFAAMLRELNSTIPNDVLKSQTQVLSKATTDFHGKLSDITNELEKKPDPASAEVEMVPLKPLIHGNVLSAIAKGEETPTTGPRITMPPKVKSFKPGDKK